MIDCIDIATAHLYGDGLAAQFRFRHQVFVERLGWRLHQWDGMEFDQFDTPATTYFVWRDQRGAVRGVARIAPTTLPYMIETVWPDMVTEEPLPHDPQVWEGSRIGIDQGLAPDLRHRILGELFCAYLEFGISRGLQRFLVFMPLAFLRRRIAGIGWPTRYLGPPRDIDGTITAAAALDVSLTTLQVVRRRMGIEGLVLRHPDNAVRPEAA